MNEYFYQFDIAAIFISFAVLITFFRKKTISTRVIKAFNFLTHAVVLSSIFDILSIFCLQNTEQIPIWCHYLINMFYHISFLFVPYTFFYCMYYAINENKRPSLWFVIVTTIPYLFCCFFVIYSPITHFIFYFDSNGIYHRGKLFNVLYTSSIIYIFLAIAQSIKRRNTITVSTLFSVYFLVMGALSASLFQYFFPKYMIMNFVLSSSVLFVYLSLENPLDYFDSEMQIFNKKGFSVMERQTLEKKAKLSAICVKINDFDYLIESIGVDNCRNVMKYISSQLKSHFHKKKLYRLDKDKVIVVISNLAADQKEEIKKILNIFTSPIHYGITNKEVILSIQAVQIDCPNDTDNINDTIYLLEQSFDSNSSGMTILSFPDGLQLKPVNTILLETKHHDELISNFIREAFDQDKFEILYQPIFSVDEQKYIAAEAFLRIKDFRFDRISPQQFIPIAENYGLVLQLGNYVLNKVSAYIEKYTLYDFGIENIHINLSTLQCSQQKLYEQFFEIMDKNQIAYKNICFNVKEQTLRDLDKISKENLERIVQKNSTLALDNFGMEIIDISKIIELPFSMIKVDKSVIWNACTDANTKSILKNNLQMIKAMNIKAAAVGVETEEQVVMMSQMGCTYLQGDYYSAPLSEKNFFDFIKKNS